MERGGTGYKRRGKQFDATEKCCQKVAMMANIVVTLTKQIIHMCVIWCITLVMLGETKPSRNVETNARHVSPEVSKWGRSLSAVTLEGSFLLYYGYTDRIISFFFLLNFA